MLILVLVLVGQVLVLVLVLVSPVLVSITGSSEVVVLVKYLQFTHSLTHSSDTSRRAICHRGDISHHAVRRTKYVSILQI